MDVKFNKIITILVFISVININIVYADYTYTILHSGSQQEKINIIFIPSGFTADEASIFESEVNQNMDKFWAVNWFSANKGSFDVYRLDSDDGESVPVWDDDGEVKTVTEWSELISRLPAGTACKFSSSSTCRNIHVILEDNLIGQESQTIGRVRIDRSSSSYCVLAHEFGHDPIGRLDDEYPSSVLSSCSGSSAVMSKNVGDTPYLTKWSHYWDGTRWVDLQAEGKISLPFEGARYCKENLYRPSSCTIMGEYWSPDCCDFDAIGLRAMDLGLQKRLGSETDIAFPGLQGITGIEHDKVYSQDMEITATYNDPSGVESIEFYIAKEGEMPVLVRECANYIGEGAPISSPPPPNNTYNCSIRLDTTRRENGVYWLDVVAYDTKWNHPQKIEDINAFRFTIDNPAMPLSYKGFFKIELPPEPAPVKTYRNMIITEHADINKLYATSGRMHIGILNIPDLDSLGTTLTAAPVADWDIYPKIIASDDYLNSIIARGATPSYAEELIRWNGLANDGKQLWANFVVFPAGRPWGLIPIDLDLNVHGPIYKADETDLPQTAGNVETKYLQGFIAKIPENSEIRDYGYDTVLGGYWMFPNAYHGLRLAVAEFARQDKNITYYSETADYNVKDRVLWLDTETANYAHEGVLRVYEALETINQPPVNYPNSSSWKEDAIEFAWEYALKYTAEHEQAEVSYRDEFTGCSPVAGVHFITINGTEYFIISGEKGYYPSWYHDSPSEWPHEGGPTYWQYVVPQPGLVDPLHGAGTGYHAYDYDQIIAAYKTKDFISVLNGSRQTYEPSFFMQMNLDEIACLGGEKVKGMISGGIAVQGNHVFVTQVGADNLTNRLCPQPIIHVFEINDAIESSCHSGADKDSSNSIGIDELIAFIEDWKAGSITINKVLVAIGEWKNGC